MAASMLHTQMTVSYIMNHSEVINNVMLTQDGHYGSSNNEISMTIDKGVC